MFHHFQVPTDDEVQSDLNQSITLCRGKRSCTSYSLYNFLSYAHLSPSFHALSSLILTLFPSLYHRPSHPGWRETMKEEMTTLEHSEN